MIRNDRGCEVYHTPDHRIASGRSTDGPIRAGASSVRPPTTPTMAHDWNVTLALSDLVGSALLVAVIVTSAVGAVAGALY